MDKEMTIWSSRILLLSCRARFRISHWYSWPHKVRNHGGEAGQLRCFHAVTYRRPSCAVTQVDCFALMNIGDWLLLSSKSWLCVPELDASVWSVLHVFLPATLNLYCELQTHCRYTFGDFVCCTGIKQDLWYLGFMSRLILWCMMCGVLRSAWWCVISVPFISCSYSGPMNVI